MIYHRTDWDREDQRNTATCLKTHSFAIQCYSWIAAGVGGWTETRIYSRGGVVVGRHRFTEVRRGTFPTPERDSAQGERVEKSLLTPGRPQPLWKMFPGRFLNLWLGLTSQAQHLLLNPQVPPPHCECHCWTATRQVTKRDDREGVALCSAVGEGGKRTP